MKIKKDDNVKVLAGKNRGKTGKILQVFRKEKKASVEGINMAIKNLKPRRKEEKGQRINYPSPMALSNMAVVCPKCGKPTRIGYKHLEGQKKARQCKKCKEVLDT